MKKRVTALLLVIVMVLAVFPAQALAASLPAPKLIEYHWYLYGGDSYDAILVADWEVVSGADDYRMQYRKNDGSWIEIENEDNGYIVYEEEIGEGIFWEDGNASYDVRIAAVDGSTTGSWLYINNINIPSYDMDPITGFTVTNVAPYSITVSWDNVDDADELALWIEDADSGYSTGENIDASKTSYTFTEAYTDESYGELEPETDYIVNIESIKNYSDGEVRAYSSSINVTTENDAIGDVVDKVVGGQLHRTYYYAYGAVQKEVVYYGADDSSVVQKINYYEGRDYRMSYKLYNESGDLINLIELYDNGKPSKVNYYNTSTAKRYAYKLYDKRGRMTHYTYTYADGVKPKKTNYYNVSTGKRYAYKLYDTAGRTTHYTFTYDDGIKPEKTNYYNVNSGIRKYYKLYDTQGRTTHYAECYGDGVKAKKVNYYNPATGVRTAYKTYRTNGSCSCWVQCNSSGQPHKATYYDEDGDVTKVVYY